MKILKYLLFFLLIGFVGSSLFLATLDGTYRVKRTILTKAPIELAFEVVNDYKTWQYWEPWNETNSTVEYSFPAQTVGRGAIFSWKATSGNGNIKNISSNANTSIQEIIDLDAKGTLNGTWKFKEVADGVEITWEIYGEMPFFTRFKSANMETETGSMLERGLALLEVYLQNELKKFSIETVGAVNYSGGYYVYQTTSGQFQDITYKTNELIVNLSKFLKNNAITGNGKPFNSYHNRDSLLQTAIFSTGILIQTPLISTDKTVLVGILPPQRTFKTILKGHYDNAALAWETAYKNLAAAGYTAKENAMPFEIFVANQKEVSNPTKWITEIYIPIEDEITKDPSSSSGLEKNN